MNNKTGIKFIRQDILQDDKIKNRIYFIRGKYVMLDEELAAIYDVELKRMNEQVKRNSPRFPDGFRFQVTEKEYKALRSQFATLNSENRRRGASLKDLGKKWFAFSKLKINPSLILERLPGKD